MRFYLQDGIHNTYLKSQSALFSIINSRSRKAALNRGRLILSPPSFSLFLFPQLIRLYRIVRIAAGVVGILGGVVGDDDGREPEGVDRGGLSFSSRRLE